MATTTKTVAKKAAAPAKKAAKPVATKPAAAVKKAPAKPVAAKPVAKSTAKPATKPAAKPVRKSAVAPEQRRNYVEVAAYYIAERHGFQPGRELADWAAAEAEIDRLLAAGLLNP